MSNDFRVFRDRGDSVFTSMMLFQMKWTECLHGTGSLRDCLTELSEIFGAPVVHLHRTCTKSGRQRTIASMDREARAGARPLTRGIGLAILGPVGSHARPGTVWTLAEADGLRMPDSEERTLRWLSDRGLREVAVIPLDHAGTEIDVLELYMPAQLPAFLRANLNGLAATASVAWSRRQKGRIARVLSAAPAVSERLAQPLAPTRISLLSPSNPSNLTAAEMRICAMFRSGASTGDIAQSLRISESTLRTHLRNIYAKTGVAGQVALVRLLLGESHAPHVLHDAG